MLGRRRDHPRVRPAGRALLGQRRLDGRRLLRALQLVDLVLPGRAWPCCRRSRTTGSASQRRPSTRPTICLLLLQQVDGGIELVLVELVDVRRSRGRAASSSGAARRPRCRSGCRRPRSSRPPASSRPRRCPSSSGPGSRLRVPGQQVRATAVGDAVGDAVDRVVRLVLQAFEHVLVVRDQVEVDRRDVLAAIRRSVASPDAETPS